MTVESTLKEIVQPFACDNVDITESTRLRDVLGLDDDDFDDLASDIEDEFDIFVDDEDIEKVKTFGDLLRLVLEALE